MKHVLFALAMSFVSASNALAFDVVTGQGTPNALVVDGMSYAIPINKICGQSSMKAGAARYEVGRDGNYVTIGGKITRIVCSGKIGGGGSAQGYHDAWKDSDLVDNEGHVTMNDGETRTELESTDPNDSGFEGHGPDLING